MIIELILLFAPPDANITLPLTNLVFGLGLNVRSVFCTFVVNLEIGSDGVLDKDDVVVVLSTVGGGGIFVVDDSGVDDEKPFGLNFFFEDYVYKHLNHLKYLYR